MAAAVLRAMLTAGELFEDRLNKRSSSRDWRTLLFSASFEDRKPSKPCCTSSLGDTAKQNANIVSFCGQINYLPLNVSLKLCVATACFYKVHGSIAKNQYRCACQSIEFMYKDGHSWQTRQLKQHCVWALSVRPSRLSPCDSSQRSDKLSPAHKSATGVQPEFVSSG